MGNIQDYIAEKNEHVKLLTLSLLKTFEGLFCLIFQLICMSTLFLKLSVIL